MLKKYGWKTHPELRRAVQCIIEGDSFHKAYKKTGVGANTIKKYYFMYVRNPQVFEEENIAKDTVKKTDFTVFSTEQEDALMKCFKYFEHLFYGLSVKECRMLAYQMLISEDMKIPVGWKHGMASVAWMMSFQVNHPDFMHNLVKPDRICTRYKLQRARMSSIRNIIWEKKTVDAFYDDLEIYLQKSPCLRDNKRIYSLDETYTSINPEIKIVDRESRDDLLTTCCFICADGTSLPPVVIKPYLPFDVCSKIPPGAVALTGSRGRMTPDLFIEVMQHFVKHSQSSLTNPSILNMDTDLCHLSYVAIHLAKESGVNILTLHPHVKNLLQPLHGEIFDSFHKSYYDAMEEWWLEHEQETDSVCDIGKFVSEAYSKAVTSENIQNGFKKCGIYPFDRDLFTDIDYESCLNQLDQTCIECRLRDDRSRKPVLEITAEDSDGAGRGSSGESQAEESEKPAGDGGESSQSQGNKEGVEKAHSNATANMTQSRAQSSQELDKLKRRLIRSVARLIKEKKSEDEVWEELKKECGKNCKTLWMRMRSLTLKKLKRLLEADDRNDIVPAVARMTLTDWLLYDLVLVHEKIDVINRSSSTDSKVLNNLFSLVQRFQIEGRSGDDLAEAWTAATVSYNSKGHQCSPMLMQRRWYQVKELTRHKLYQFWFNYRGNERLLINAKQDPPTPLQRAIALRYPEVVTRQFPNWKERVEQKLVIMPEEFEVKMRKKDLMKPSDEAIPDVVIVEQKIDTITVDSDSEFDDDENRDSAFLEQDVTESETSQTPTIVQVKSEPEDPYDNIDITEHPVYPDEPKDRYQDAIERLRIEEENITMSHVTADRTLEGEVCVMPFITSVTGAAEITTTHDISMENNDMATNLENATDIHNTEQAEDTTRINKESEDVINTFDDNSQESIVIDDDDDHIKPTKNGKLPKMITSAVNQMESNVINIASPKTKQTREANDITSNISSDNHQLYPIITAVASGLQGQTKMEMNFVNDKSVDDVLPEEDVFEDIIRIGPEFKSNSDSANEVTIETNIAHDGFEFADDGIEYDEEHNESSEFNETLKSPLMENVSDKNAGVPKFDLKLLMNPVVYTTKLDKMKVYKDISLYDTIDEKQLLDKIILESKPVSARSINVDQIKADNHNIKEANNIQANIDNSQDLNDDLFQNESSNASDNEMLSNYDIKRVKLSSFLLQKPRSRSYNPIQLCKNPDFNTRLKRLTVGFFSSKRNRVFLKACKPMTIDLSKAFESKLVEGTMYLKPSDPIVKNEVEDVSESAASITPSAVAVQSLMDTVDVDKILQEELRKRMLERNKTITLPNISVVRQINQNLLLAEVSPIITQVEKSTREVINILNHNSIVETRVGTDTHANVITNETPTHTVKQIASVTNSDKSTKETITNIANSLLPMMNNDKLREDKTLEKQKKKFAKSNIKRPLWSTKLHNLDSNPYSESLLTIDTLYKVLNTLDPTSVDYRPKTKTSNKIIHPRPGNQTNYPNDTTNTEQEQPATNATATNALKINPPVSNLPATDSSAMNPPVTKTPAINLSTTISPATNLPLTNSPATNLPTTKPATVNQISRKGKANVGVIPRRPRSCCWARSRINKLNGVSKIREYKHKCPTANCRCCCREILRQTEINHEIRLLEQMQNSDQFDETIETVVQQSRELSNVPSLPVAQTRFPTLNQYAQIQQARALSSIGEESRAASIETPGVYLTNTHFTPQQTSKRISVAIQVDDFDDRNAVTIINDTEKKNIDTAISVPEKETEVTIDLVDDDENVSESEIQSPTPKIRVIAATAAYYAPGIETRVAKKVQARKPTPPVKLATKLLPKVVVPPSPIQRGSRVISKVATSPKTEAMELKNSIKELDDILSLPCICRLNVGVDKRASMLVVDGSNVCPRHTKSRVSKETRIYLNRKHMSAAARPFYVGKNKILLTNVSPRKIEPPPTLPPPSPQPPTPPVPLELPEGVQVVLLSDGTISYIIDPGVELTREQIHSIPIALSAILHQIKASGITLPITHPSTDESMTIFSPSNDASKPIESVDSLLSDVQNNESSDINGQNSENNKANDGVPSTTSDLMQEHKDNANPDTNKTESQKKTNQESSNETGDILKNKTEIQKEVDQKSSVEDNRDTTAAKNTSEGEEHSLSNDTTVDKKATATDVAEVESSICSNHSSNLDNPMTGTEGPGENYLVHGSESENISKTAENENTINSAASSSRNLLSDLMEMSGILEEDVATNTALESIQPLTIDTSQDLSVGQDSPLSPTAQKHSISAQINEKIYNLNPITSFAELKYACDNNGLFFKLDLNTGLIVPINVCIQKSPESASAKNFAPSEVIDLTGDPSFTVKDSAAITMNNDDNNLKLNESNIPRVYKHSSQKLKPRDLSTLLPPQPRLRGRPRKHIIPIQNQFDIEQEVPSNAPVAPSTRVLSIDEKKEALMKRLSNNLKPLKIQQNKRNSVNILRKNSLLHSNTSLLKRISNAENKAEAETTSLLVDDSSDDSDDEPLAKIAKRMRPNTNESILSQESLEVPQDNAMNDDNVDFEEAIDAISAVEPPSILNSLLQASESAVEPVPTQLVLSGAALELPLPTIMENSINYVQNESDDEDSDGDCILGV